MKTNTPPTGDNVKFIVLDVETANEDKYSICQIGIAEVTNSGEIETLGFLVDPKVKFDRFNINLHGIDENAVKGENTFAEVVEKLRPALESNNVITHAKFAKEAFQWACDECNAPKIKTKWYDSWKVAKNAWPELSGKGAHGLANLKNVLGLKFKDHDAEQDARALAMIVLSAEIKTDKPFNKLSRLTKKKPTIPPINKVEVKPAVKTYNRPEYIAAVAPPKESSGTGWKIVLWAIGVLGVLIILSGCATTPAPQESQLASEFTNQPQSIGWLTGFDGWSFYVPQAVLVHQEAATPVWFGRAPDAGGERLSAVKRELIVIN